jgi:hypothetical protein
MRPAVDPETPISIRAVLRHTGLTGNPLIDRVQRPDRIKWARDYCSVLVAEKLVSEELKAAARKVMALYELEFVSGDGLIGAARRVLPPTDGEMLAMLRSLEWINDDQGCFCPRCYGDSPNHIATCDLAALLARAGVWP